MKISDDFFDFNTALTHDELDRYRERINNVDHAEIVAGALQYVDAESRESWVTMGMCVKSEFGDDGFGIWNEWSRTAGNYDERAATATWRSISPSGKTTIGTLFYEAEKGGWSRGASQYVAYHFSPEAVAAREAQKRADEYEEAARHARGSARSREVYAASIPMPDGGSHPYLVKKKVAPRGDVRIAGPSSGKNAGCLFVPARNAAGDIVAGQYIPEVGEKKAVFECPLNSAGAFFEIPGDPGTVAIVEGYATGLSVYEATGWTVAVTFTSANMPRAAKEAKKRYGEDKRYYVLGDYDSNKEAAGQKAAKRAATEIAAKWLCPDVSGLDGASDWNDIANLHQGGVEEVRRQLLKLKAFRVDILGSSWDDYAGPAPAYEWVVEGILPKGALVVLAARGGTGKGMMMLDLGLQVASAEPEQCVMDTAPPTAFGNRIVSHGPVVLMFAEDSRKELHRRISSLGRSRPKYPFHAIPVVDMGGVKPLFKEPSRKGDEEGSVVATPEWREWEEQMRIIQPTLIVIDPLSSFVALDISSKPEIGQQIQNRLAALASEMNCSIVICHHMNKPSGARTTVTADDARNSIRGTTGLVDGARGAYALWPGVDKRARQYCMAAGAEWNEKRVVLGALVKDNFPGDTETHIYIRDEHGLLVERSGEIRRACAENDDILMDSLEDEIAAKAGDGIPYTVSGKTDGLHERAHEMPAELAGLSRDRVRALADKLLAEKRIVKCAERGKKDRKFLDVPGGNFASGDGVVFPVGARNG